MRLVLLTQDDLDQIELGIAIERWPLNPDSGIISHETAFIIRMVDIIAFVVKLGSIRLNKEAVREPARDKNWRLFSAERTTPSHLPYVGLPLRRSTATSKTLPEAACTSFVYGCSI